MQQKLTEKIIADIEQGHAFSWYELSADFDLPESFIRKYRHKVNWNTISSCQNLSEEFMMEFFFELNLRNLLIFQKLSESFIEKISDIIFQHNLNKKIEIWEYISAYQKLSKEFILRHIEDINWRKLSMFGDLSEDVMETFFDKIHWKYIIYSRNSKNKFVIKNKKRIMDKLNAFF
jgi:hypothetical protein